MKKITQILFILFSIYSCKSQNTRIENDLIKCYNDAELVNEILDFEKELIAHNILKNSNGKSYILLLEKIKNGKKITIEIPEIKKGILITSEIANCQQNIFKSKGFKNSKIYKINNQFEKDIKKGNVTVPNVIGVILEVLEAQDFDLPYYKLSVFKILAVYNTEIGIVSKLPTLTEYKTKKEQLVNSFEVFINDENKVFVNGEIKTKNELKFEIYNYEKTNKNKSVIFIKSTRNTLYKVYLNITDLIGIEIDKLRNEYSIKLFSKGYHKLSKENKKIINKTYPKKIIETEPE